MKVHPLGFFEDVRSEGWGLVLKPRSNAFPLLLLQLGPLALLLFVAGWVAGVALGWIIVGVLGVLLVREFLTSLRSQQTLEVGRKAVSGTVTSGAFRVTTGKWTVDRDDVLAVTYSPGIVGNMVPTIALELSDERRKMIVFNLKSSASERAWAAEAIAERLGVPCRHGRELRDGEQDLNAGARSPASARPIYVHGVTGALQQVTLPAARSQDGMQRSSLRTVLCADAEAPGMKNLGNQARENRRKKNRNPRDFINSNGP